jgi:hypothetical protein
MATEVRVKRCCEGPFSAVHSIGRLNTFVKSLLQHAKSLHAQPTLALVENNVVALDICSLLRPESSRLTRDLGTKQLGNLLKRFAMPPSLPHQCPVTVGIVNPRSPLRVNTPPYVLVGVDKINKEL